MNYSWKFAGWKNAADKGHWPDIIVQFRPRFERLANVSDFFELFRNFEGKYVLVAALLGLLSATVGADDWSGRVVAVHDGDTLTVLRAGVGIKVRLDQIDAPELGQDYGRESRKSLSGLCFGRTAEVRGQGQDQYGRVLGRVICAGIDANAEQVRRGYAWFYRRYGRDPVLRNLEASARARRAGLWAGPNPGPPWKFRHESLADRFGRARRPAASPPHGSRCGTKKTCGEMGSCEEALYYLNRCGLGKLDRNHDGVPCESLCR